VAYITYIRLRVEFVYLAVILDGFSRKVVGWALERTLTSRLAIAALREAIVKRQPRPGLIHHSDRGVQYASGDYVAILEQQHMIPSMSRPANPYDNASCESFMKTLKREEIYANAYENLEHLRANLEIFLVEYYNQQRLHSALGYRTPEEFERQVQCQSEIADAKAATVTFVAGLAQSSTGLLEQGTQTPSPAPDLIPAGESDTASRRANMCQARTVSTTGFNIRKTAGVPI
jgi:putative transposase